MNRFNWIALILLICVLCGVIALLIYILVRFLLRMCRKKLLLNEDQPVTCVVFEFDENLSLYMNSKGAEKADKLYKNLKSVIFHCCEEHDVFVVLTSSGCIRAICEDAYQAVKCCLAVRSEAETICVSEGCGENTFSINMGLASGIISKHRSVKKISEYRGFAMIEAVRIATEMCSGAIIAAETTWYAMSESEGNNILATGPHFRCLTDLVMHETLKLRTNLRQYYVIHSLKHAEISEGRPDTIVVPNPYAMISTCLNRVPLHHRIGLLLALLRSWGVEVPFKEPRMSEEGYGKVLLDTLLDRVSGDEYSNNTAAAQQSSRTIEDVPTVASMESDPYAGGFDASSQFTMESMEALTPL